MEATVNALELSVDETGGALQITSSEFYVRPEAVASSRVYPSLPIANSLKHGCA